MGKPKADISITVLRTLYVTEKRSGLETARLLGIGRSTLSRYLKKLDIPERSISEVRKNNKWSPSAEQKRKLSELGKSQTGENNPYWKGGAIIDDEGYRRIRVGNQYIPEHRYIMSQELKRKLLKSEDVHHLNGDKLDNRPDNLILLSKKHHSRLHWSSAERRQSQSEQIKEHYKNGKVLTWQERKSQ